MRYKLLGRSGLRVSELCFGAMTFGGGVGSIGVGGSSDAQSRAIFDRYVQAGGNFFDTACSYSGGRSEELLGDFCAADRDSFVIATKYTNSHNGGLMRSGNSRRNMVRSVEESLRRLKTDRIDLFWLHIWDATTPVDELMRAFDDLVTAGKVLYIGAADMPAWEISRANMLADLQAMTPFIGIQVEYSLLQRSCDNDLLPMAKSLDLGITAWSPLARGALARGPEIASGSSTLTEREQSIHRAVDEVAREIDATRAQVALAAIRQMDRYGTIIPIIGASRVEQLEDNLGCLDVRLSADQLARVEAVSVPSLIFPHALLRSSLGEKLTHGGQAGQLDNHRA
jgi:aryl-alcohol dehydrogenase-like predicted oxidoreductase